MGLRRISPVVRLVLESKSILCHTSGMWLCCSRFIAIAIFIGSSLVQPLGAKPNKERACALAKWELEVSYIRGCDLATCQVAGQSGQRTFEVSMECPAAPNGDKARLKTMISFDATVQPNPFQRELLRVMQCVDGAYRYGALSELLRNYQKFKDPEKPDLYGVTVGGVYFQKAESCGGHCDYFMLTAEPSATAEDVRRALGWTALDLSTRAVTRKILTGDSGVYAVCGVPDQ